MQFLNAQPQLIVCGRLRIQPPADVRRRELLSSVNLFDALESVARLQGRWDVAYTTTQRPDRVEAEFLASGTGEECRRARKRVVTHRDLLVSPRATAQLQREIIEYASADEAAPARRDSRLPNREMKITSASPLVGRCLADTALGLTTGALVLAIGTASGQFIANPAPDTRLDPDTILIVLGTSAQLGSIRSHVDPVR